MEGHQEGMPMEENPNVQEAMESKIDPSNPLPDRSCSIFEVDECVFILEACGIERGMEVAPLTNLGAQIGCYASLQVCLYCPLIIDEFG